ncbi:MAG: response regulator [Methylovirgula sp.]
MSAIAITSSNDNSPNEEPSDRSGQEGVDATPRAQVLVVEDEWFISMEIEATLEDAGYEVIGVATNADEALHKIEQHRPKLVLMDIRIRGDRDGLDTAMEINRRFGLRCVFVSAYMDARTRERGQAANPLAWLAKPFSAPQLVATVENALRDLK